VKRTTLAVLICAALVANAGCCGAPLHRLLCCPLGPGTQCDPTHCGHVYTAGVPGPAYGPVAAPDCRVACGPGTPVACESCGPAPCEPAGVGACGPIAQPGCGPAFGPPCGGGCVGPCGAGPCYGLLGGVLRALFPPSWCGSGCGPIYWSEFHSDPPDCCDPCDRCGNFTGGGSVSCVSCGPGACGPTTCDPATCDPAMWGTAGRDAPAPIAPIREYVSRRSGPLEPVANVTRLTRPPKAQQR